MPQSQKYGWFGCAVALVLALAAPQAKAVFIVNILQQGTDVVATGSGSINLQGLTFKGAGSVIATIDPGFGFEVTEPTNVLADVYSGITGPLSFGPGTPASLTSGSGSVVGIQAPNHELFVPKGYMSGDSLFTTGTVANTTLASLGATPGVYTYTLPSTDTYIVSIGSVFPVATAVPEPGTVYGGFAAALGLGGLAIVRRRKRQTVA